VAPGNSFQKRGPDTISSWANGIRPLFLQFKLPSAWVPIAMSSLAVIILVVHIIKFGTAPEFDEGVSAHLWQLLMVGQVPVIGWFLLRWSRISPRRSAWVIAAQVVAFIVALAPVYLLGL
jgi:hypothetical protein